jgi:hypothetical protein
LRKLWGTKGVTFRFCFLTDWEEEYAMLSFEAEQNALREQRIACAGCNMFEWGDKMVEDGNGNRYHSSCLMHAKTEWAKKKAQVIQLVPREETLLMPSEERRQQPLPISGDERRSA